MNNPVIHRPISHRLYSIGVVCGLSVLSPDRQLPQFAASREGDPSNFVTTCH
jgi:hypothetical protein